MSFLTAVLTALGGYGQGRQQRTQNQEEQQRLDIERENAESQRSYETQQTTALQNTNDQYQQSRAFEKGLKYPANWSKMAPADQYNYLQVRYNNAIAAGDTEAAKQTLDQMNSLPRAGYEFASATEKLEGQLPLDQAKAKAVATAQQTAITIAQGHDQNQWRIASARIANSRYLAQYGYGEKWAIANLAGAYMLQGKSEQDATQTAIATYNGEVKEYVAGTNPEQSLLNPNYVQPGEPAPPQAQGPGITQNFNIGGPAPPIKTTGDNNTNSTNSTNNGNKPPPAPVQKLSATEALKTANDALKSSGGNKSLVYYNLQKMVQNGQITAEAANGVELLLHLTPGQAP